MNTEPSKWNEGKYERPDPTHQWNDGGRSVPAVPVPTRTLSKQEIEALMDQKLARVQGEFPTEDFNSYGTTVRRAEGHGGAEVSIVDDVLHVTAGSAEGEDESTLAFGFSVSGNVVTVYRGTICLQTQTFTVATTPVTVSGTHGCVYVQLKRDLTVAEISQSSDYTGDPYYGDGVFNDADYWRWPIASFTNNSGTLTTVRRHHRGGSFKLDTPAV